MKKLLFILLLSGCVSTPTQNNQTGEVWQGNIQFENWQPYNGDHILRFTFDNLGDTVNGIINDISGSGTLFPTTSFHGVRGANSISAVMDFASKQFYISNPFDRSKMFGDSLIVQTEGNSDYISGIIIKQ